ncbi:MAG: hypothetical protein ACLQUT_00530 [Thermoleophilia bacterium]
MNGWILFAIAMVSLAAVLVAAALAAIAGWRLTKHAGRFAGDIASALEPTLRGANAAAAKAAGLGDAAQTLTNSLSRLQTTLARLNVLSDASQDGLAPWRTVRSYLGL